MIGPFGVKKDILRVSLGAIGSASGVAEPVAPEYLNAYLPILVSVVFPFLLRRIIMGVTR